MSNGKKLMMGMAAAALGMVGGLGPTAVETAQTIAQSETVIEAQAPQRNVNQGQQSNAVTQRASQQAVRDYNRMPDLPPVYYSDCGLSPKEYGLYLLRTGKNKYNDRKRKHYAKAWA